MTAATIKRTVKPGDTFDLTNHYISAPDHPCYGTRRVTVTTANDSSFRYEADGGGTGMVRWPKAAQLAADTEAGTITLRGGGVGQQSHELFLTLARVEQKDA